MFGPRKSPGLVKITLGIVFLVALAFAGIRFLQWFHGEYAGQTSEADAAVLGKARDLLSQGNISEAKALLQPLIKRKRAGVAPRALMLLAEIEQAAGNDQAAVALLERTRKDFPASAKQPRVLEAYARLLEKVGRTSEAVAFYETIRSEAAAGARAPALIGLGRDAERKKNLLAARDLYSQAVREAEWNSDVWNEALDAAGQVNVTLVFSPEQTPESKVYTVQNGDNLTDVGVKLNTTMGMLCRANGIGDATRIWPGQQLKYTPKDFRVVIERSTCRLFLLDKDGLFKRYYVGLGQKGHETATGSFKIGNKEKDPTWHKRGEGPIPPGDPRNELGTRWMPLVPVEEGLPQDLGIHGTLKPETVGIYVSMGCARMQCDDVEELYDLVVRSTPVDIVEVFDPKSI